MNIYDEFIFYFSPSSIYFNAFLTEYIYIFRISIEKKNKTISKKNFFSYLSRNKLKK